MNKSKIAALAAAALMLSGCGAQAQTEVTETSAAISSETVTKAPETPEEFHAAMVERSLLSLGNTSRMKAKIKQAQSGEKTVVAYIGGSITEGYLNDPEECYAKRSFDFFAENYGTGDNAEYVNAGLSGTPSDLGILRLERDVLAHKPDIVFVEFAVNDGQDKKEKESFESLIRTVLMQENAPAVALIFNRTSDGYTAQELMKKTGEFYDLPMISVTDAITMEIDEGRMEWADYSNDGAHPHSEGNALISEFVENMFIQAEKSESEEYTVPGGTLYGAPYQSAQMITPDDAESDYITLSETGSFETAGSGAAGFPVSWKLGEGSDPMKMTVKGNALFVIFKRNNSDSMGSFDVYIDGEKLKTVHTNQADGWGEAFSEQIIKFQSVRDMEIEIRPSEGSEGKDIEILGFAASQNVSF